MLATKRLAELQLMAIAAKQNVECGKLESGKKFEVSGPLPLVHGAPASEVGRVLPHAPGSSMTELGSENAPVGPELDRRVNDHVPFPLV
jgi:hypothetical protein